MTRLVLGLLLLAPARARADVLWGGPRPPDLRLEGGFEARPYLGYSEVYDSNLFRRPQPASTWIHTFKAGLRSAWAPGERHRLDLDYTAAYEMYSRAPGVNDAAKQDAAFLYKYARPSGLTARVRDEFLSTVDPPNVEQTDRLLRWQNAAAADADWAPEERRLTFGADASQVTHKYVADAPLTRALLNRYEQAAGVTLGYRVQPKTRAFVTYHRGVVRYTAATASPTKDHKSHLVSGGFEGELSPKVKGRVEAGMVYRRYDDEPVPGAGRTVRGLTFAGSLNYEPLERTDVDLAVSRRLEEALLIDNRYYTATGGSLSLRHALPAGVTLSALAATEEDAFPEEVTFAGMTLKRRDRFYQGRVGVDYDVRDWVRVGLSYAYLARFSRQLSAQFDYRDQITALSVIATF